MRTDRAEALIRRALPELPWPARPLLDLPARVHRRYLTLPIEYAMGFTVLMLLLPGWWKLLALLPPPLGYVLGVARAREARWLVDELALDEQGHRVTDPNAAAPRRPLPSGPVLLLGTTGLLVTVLTQWTRSLAAPAATCRSRRSSG